MYVEVSSNKCLLQLLSTLFTFCYISLIQYSCVGGCTCVHACVGAHDCAHACSCHGVHVESGLSLHHEGPGHGIQVGSIQKGFSPSPSLFETGSFTELELNNQIRLAAQREHQGSSFSTPSPCPPHCVISIRWHT